jgi:heat shock protein HtpX
MVAMAAALLAIGYFVGLAFFNNPIAGLIIALLIYGIMSMVAFFQGDSIMLGVSRARKISQQDYPRLYNVVEEMKIASGLEKMPDIYIIDDPALNAFATGRDPNHASVAITSGLLQKLNRDELQGVIGHEMSHVKNRDVLLMSLAGVMLGTIVIISWYATRFLIFGGMSGGRRDSKGGGQAQLIILVVGIVFMILAPIAAQLIYFAISRKREYLADASSALYTRYPEGLASALQKLADSTAELKSANQATAPMYIINPLHKQGLKASDLTSTHPPISQRIRILRAMAGGASLADYERAYEKEHGRGGLLPKAAVATAGAVGLREASSPEPLGEGNMSEKAGRTREVTGVLDRINDYRIIDCPCGTRLKVPPALQGRAIKCPHCGRIHQA